MMRSNLMQNVVYRQLTQAQSLNILSTLFSTRGGRVPKRGEKMNTVKWKWGKWRSKFADVKILEVVTSYCEVVK